MNANSHTPQSNRVEHIVFLGLCAIVALVPLPLGAARPLAWNILELCVGLLAALALLIPAGAFPTSAYRNLLFPALLFSTVVGFAFLQANVLLSMEWQNALWDQAAYVLGRDVRGSIAVDRFAAFSYLGRLICYCGVFYLALVTGRRAAHAKASVRLVSISGSIYAIYALFIYWSGNRTVLWYPKWAYPDDLTGTFVNRNSFATYLGLCTLASFCIVLHSFARIEFRGDWRKRVAASIEFFTSHIGDVLLLFISATALILTHSRGGLIATISGLAGLMVIIALIPKGGGLRRISRWAIAPFIVFLIALFVSGGGSFARFVSVEFDAEQRLAVYQLTLRAIRDYPWGGIGLGSFARVFPIYRTSEIRTYFDLAHNDYLQNLLELGIPAALCLFVSIFWLIAECLRGVRMRQRDGIYPCLAVAASILVGLHATIDFSLQIPAVTVVYIFLLGIGVAQSRSSREEPAPSSNGSRREASQKPGSSRGQKSAPA